ncbi:MAG: helix-turn-helix domain-containing protein [Thermomicrobiales bacterium]
MSHPTKRRELLISVQECETILELSAETIYALVESGEWIGSRKVGRTYVIPRRAFERLYVEGDVRELATTPINPFLIRRNAA